METTKGEEKNTDDSGPVDDGQATTTVPESSGKDAVNSNPKPEKPKKMKMSSLIPCEFDNDLHEDLRKEEEFRQRQAEKKEREKQLAQE